GGRDTRNLGARRGPEDGDGSKRDQASRGLDAFRAGLSALLLRRPPRFRGSSVLDSGGEGRFVRADQKRQAQEVLRRKSRPGRDGDRADRDRALYGGVRL